MFYIKRPGLNFPKKSLLNVLFVESHIELVSKELNHLAAILHVYAGALNFMK